MNPVTVQVPFAPGPVFSAGSLPLRHSSGGQPFMGETLLDWFEPMVLGVITTVIQTGEEDETQNGVAKETVREVATQGCFQAGTGEKLDIQSVGERSWQNGVLHTMSDFNVPTDSIIRNCAVRYRIKAKGDYSTNGFIRYELVEDYTPAVTPAQTP